MWNLKRDRYREHRYREQTCVYQWGEGREEGQFGMGKKGLIWDYMKSCV